MRRTFNVLSCLLIWFMPSHFAECSSPNVLFIIVDDLNDWIGVMGGHPQAHTPNIDGLARRGMLFENAHCTAPICNASRASVLTGLLPTTSGVHGNNQDWRRSPHIIGKPTLPQYFKQNGYWTAGGGKIYHANHGGEAAALSGGHGGRRGLNHPDSWTERFPSKDVQLPKPAVLPGQNFNGLDIWHWDWGAIDVADAETIDGRTSDWGVAQLQRRHDLPFFLAVGIYRPHGPWYVPRQYFDIHPLEKVVVPMLKKDDLEDVPEIATTYLTHAFSDYHRLILEHGLYQSAVQAYLANVTFADAMVGKVLDALWTSPYADNTIVCLWSDHGWHLGEKQKWHKSTNWEEATRVPLIFVAPGVTQPGSSTNRPASLVDLYPTLVELCGLPPSGELDGESLVPLLKDPTAPRERPALTTQAGRHHSIRSERWRYIRYSNGAEELYDHDNDPHEWTNLANRPDSAAVKKQLAAWLPNTVNVVPSDDEPGSIEAGFRYLFNGEDLTSWEGDPKTWKVEDGAITGTTSDAAPLPHNSFLIWRGGRLKNFELRLKVRLEGDNNSGIQYRSQERRDLGEWVISGYQADIHAHRLAAGMLYDEQGRKLLALSGQKVVVTPEAKKMVVGTVGDPSAALRPDEWNEYAIIARGNHLIHQINGRTTVEVFDHDPAGRAMSGLLAAC